MKDQSCTICHIGENDVVFFDTNFISPNAGVLLNPLPRRIEDLKNLCDVSAELICTSDIVMMEYKKQQRTRAQAIKENLPKVIKEYCENGFGSKIESNAQTIVEQIQKDEDLFDKTHRSSRPLKIIYSIRENHKGVFDLYEGKKLIFGLRTCS